MSRIYIIRDSYAETLRQDDDLGGWQEYIDESSVMWLEVEFTTEEAETNYISGLFAGYDERSPAGMVVLYDTLPEDRPYIDVLINQ